MARWGDGWLTRSEHVLSEVMPASAEEVRAFFCDLPALTRLHPLVVSVRIVARDDGEHGYAETYRVRDRIPLGPFRLPIVYTARIEVPVAGDVRTEARQFPRVRLHGVLCFEQERDGTRVTERLRIDAPRPLAAVTATQAVTAHADMLAGVRRTFQ